MKKPGLLKTLVERLGYWTGELTRDRNPWEKGPIASWQKALYRRWAQAFQLATGTLKRYQRPLGWAFSAALLGATVIASFVFTLPLLLSGERERAPVTVTKRAPDPEQIQKQLETALLARDFPLARQKLEELRALWPDDARLHQAEGALLMVDQQDFSAARKHFLTALRLRPSDEELLFNLAEAEFFLKNYKDAEAFYQQIAPNQPRSDLISFRRYLCSLMLGEMEDAALFRERASVSFQSPAWFYIESIEASRRSDSSQARKLIEAAHLMHGDKTRIFDQTLDKLHLQP